jgi:carbamoyl-phosphate synthase large subunit
VNILLTGAGAPGAAGIIRCLSKENSFDVMAVDVNPETPGRHLVKKFVVVPHGDDPEFIPVLLDICRKNDIHVVLPLVTRELIPLAMHTSEFELAGACVMVAPVSSLEIANNKSRLYEFLDWRGIAVPAFRVIEEAGQLREACTSLGYPARDVVIRPSVSNGGRGFRIISSAFDPVHLLFHEKPGQPFVQLEELENILSKANPLPEMLVSEFLPGDELSVDCLCREGDTLVAVPRLRKKMVSGISVAGEFVQDREAIAYCSQVAAELKLHGSIGFQLKKSAADQWLILEINPRLQGTTSAALGAGINLPVMAVQMALGNAAISIPEIKWGTRFGRVWEEIFF